MKKYGLLFLILIGLSACSSLPPELEATSEQPITDYQQWVNSNPDKSVEVRLGGIITKVTNLSDQTRIEIVNLPISSNGKPSLESDPKGRFVAYVDGFLEPVNYKPGRLITVVGQSTEPEKGKVGEYSYTFPTLKANGQRLWTIEKSTYIENDDWWMRGCLRGSTFCHNYGPTRARVIQEVK
ncbi:Slp family lipoprotein [Vibrio sp. E150_018]